MSKKLTDKQTDKYIDKYCMNCSNLHPEEDCGEEDAYVSKTIKRCMKEKLFVKKY